MKRNEDRSLSKWNAINDALLQIIPLFKMPLLKKSILIFTIQFCALMGFVYFCFEEKLIKLIKNHFSFAIFFQFKYVTFMAAGTVYNGF